MKDTMSAKDVIKLTLQRASQDVLENIRQHKVLLWQLDRKAANAMLINEHAV